MLESFEAIKAFIVKVGIFVALEAFGGAYLVKAYSNFDFGVAEIGALLMLSGAAFEIIVWAIQYWGWRKSQPTAPGAGKS